MAPASDRHAKQREDDVMRQMLRGYLALGAGFAEIARQRLVDLGKTVAEDRDIDLEKVAAATAPVLRQVQDTAVWLAARSRANREIVTEMVREEVERTAVALGFVRAEDFDDLEDRVDELEQALADLTAIVKPAAGRAFGEQQPATPSSTAQPPAKKTATKKTATKKSTSAKQTPSAKKTASAKKTTPTKKTTTPAKKTAAPTSEASS